MIETEYSKTNDCYVESTLIVPELTTYKSEEVKDSKAKDYQGSRSQTRGGHTCQKWSTLTGSQYITVGDHNHCRNPDGADWIWCYTNYSKRAWAFCDPHIQVCDETLRGEKGTGYRGCQAKTLTGKDCQAWPTKDIEDFPQTGLEGGHNYCRNPDMESTIWCFTTDPDKKWEFCEPTKE